MDARFEKSLQVRPIKAKNATKPITTYKKDKSLPLNQNGKHPCYASACDRRHARQRVTAIKPTASTRKQLANEVSQDNRPQF